MWNRHCVQIGGARPSTWVAGTSGGNRRFRIPKNGHLPIPGPKFGAVADNFEFVVLKTGPAQMKRSAPLSTASIRFTRRPLRAAHCQGQRLLAGDIGVHVGYDLVRCIHTKLSEKA